MNFLGIRALVTEAVTYGATHRDKNENLTALAEKYSLRQLVYVGDTEGDCVRHILPGCRLFSPRMVSAIVTMRYDCRLV